jgi:hypothetical protein
MRGEFWGSRLGWMEWNGMEWNGKLGLAGWGYEDVGSGSSCWCGEEDLLPRSGISDMVMN